MVALGNFLFRYRNGLFLVPYLLLFVPGRPLLENDFAAAALGLLVAGLGQVIRAATIGLAYIIRGGRRQQVYAEHLVTEGIFTHCRNPLYVGNYLVIVGLALAANNTWFALVGLPFFFVAYWAIILAEENFLRGKFGAAYDDYCARVGRILPKFSGLYATLRSMQFNWPRLVIKEYGSTFSWMAGMTLVLMKNLWAHRGPEAARPALMGLGAVLGLLTAAYGAARYAKKRGILKEA